LKRLFLYILILNIVTISSYPQVAGSHHYNPLSDRWAITAEGGVTYSFTDFKNSLTDIYVRLIGEYYFPTTHSMIFGLKLQAGIGNLKGDGDGITNYPFDEFQSRIMLGGAGLNLALAISEVVIPYFYVGGFSLKLRPDGFTW